MFTNDEYVQLMIEGHSPIPIKKQTLRSASPYFATLLKYNEERIHMAPPANVHLDCYVAVLYSVSNNVEPEVDESNMWDFFVLARYFLMKPLEGTCSRVIRQALPTLTMDELCRLWRHAHAEQCQDVAKWFLAGIVRNLDQASQSVELLSFSVEEMLALLRDDEFLPLFEKDVYKAIIAWCEYNPEQRMNPEVLDVLLAEVVWDHYDNEAIRLMATSSTPPLRSVLENLILNKQDAKKPKRAVERHLVVGHEAFVHRQRGPNRRTREFLHYDSLRGILCAWNAPTARTLCTKGSWRYVTHTLMVGKPTVMFVRQNDWGPPLLNVTIVNVVNGGARVIGNDLGVGYSMEMVMGGYYGWLNWCYQEFVGFLGFNSALSTWRWEPKPAPFQCDELQGVSSCLLELPEGRRIAHLLSFVRYDASYKSVPDSVVGFHETHEDFYSVYEVLAALPAPRRDAAIVQCGTFLFVTGGAVMTDDNVELAKQCYRLDLTARDHWERIGDLSVPRVNHCMFVQSGRVFVNGGSTLADKNKVALWSFETYDPYADMWTVFSIPLTGDGRKEMGDGSFGDSQQTTYCLDLGSSVHEAEYQDIVDKIY